jgi:hypothetical protein
MEINVPILADEVLDYHWLRTMSDKNGTPPHWFGLGFIQLKLTPDTRIHFWLPWLKGKEREEIHNHRYNFTSRILAGSLHKEIYEVFNRGKMGAYDWELFTTTCAPGKEGEVTKTTPVDCEKIAEFDLGAGSTYFFRHDQFHTTEGTDFAITYLERENKVKSDAMVVKRAGVPTTCPFANPIDAVELWDHIHAALEFQR